MAERRIVLLRAVNLGGHHRVPMARLRELVNGAGATDVATLLASGNLVCTPPATARAAAFDRTVEQLVEDDLGVRTDAISRSAAELSAALEAYPFEVRSPKLAHVWFLADEPDPAGVDALRERDTGDTEWEHLGGRELFLRYPEAGVHGSKVTAALLGRLLGTPGTGRNVETVRKLVELALT